jgi:hypothetical protein
LRVELELTVEGVADAALESSQRLLGRLAFGDCAVEEGPAFAVAEADLGDGGDVDGVVELSVASRGAPRTPRWGPCRCRRRIGPGS